MNKLKFTKILTSMFMNYFRKYLYNETVQSNWILIKFPIL